MIKKYELIMKLEDIPEYSTVRKIQGTNEYKVLSSVNIYSKTDDAEKQKISTKNGCKFLVSQDGLNITAYSGETKFIVEMDEEELYRLLDNEEDYQ